MQRKTLVGVLVCGLNLSGSLFAAKHVELVEGDSPVCDDVFTDIRDQLDVTFENLPLALAAPTRLLFSGVVKKSFVLDRAIWGLGFSSVEVSLTTIRPYPKSIDLDSTANLMEYFHGDESVINTVLSMDVAENIDGAFELKMKFDLWSNDFGSCVIEASLGHTINITSEHPDMVPPLVQGIFFDKLAYSPGEDVELTLLLSEPLLHDLTDRLEFINLDLPVSEQSPGFPWSRSDDMYYGLKRMADGLYRVKFTVPSYVASGRYVLKWFSRVDHYANGEDEVGKFDLTERAVAMGQPLLVEKLRN